MTNLQPTYGVFAKPVERALAHVINDGSDEEFSIELSLSPDDPNEGAAVYLKQTFFISSMVTVGGPKITYTSPRTGHSGIYFDYSEEGYAEALASVCRELERRAQSLRRMAKVPDNVNTGFTLKVVYINQARELTEKSIKVNGPKGCLEPWLLTDNPTTYVINQSEQDADKLPGLNATVKDICDLAEVLFIPPHYNGPHCIHIHNPDKHVIVQALLGEAGLRWVPRTIISADHV